MKAGAKHNATYGEEADLQALLDNLKKKFIDKGYPVINGEYGVIWRTVTGANESQEKHNASIKYYYRFMNQLCMERGIVPMVWDTNYCSGTNNMTIIDRKNLSVYNPYMMEGIHEAMEVVGIPVTAVSSVKNDRAVTNSIYDLSGRIVAENQLKASLLPKGIYIRNGKKYVIQ